ARQEGQGAGRRRLRSAAHGWRRDGGRGHLGEEGRRYGGEIRVRAARKGAAGTPPGPRRTAATGPGSPQVGRRAGRRWGSPRPLHRAKARSRILPQGCRIGGGRSRKLATGPPLTAVPDV